MYSFSLDVKSPILPALIWLGNTFINTGDDIIGMDYGRYVGVVLFNFGNEHDEGNGIGIALMSVFDALQMRKLLRKEACQVSCRGIHSGIMTRKSSLFRSLCSSPQSILEITA